METVAAEFEQDQFDRVDSVDDADFVLNMVDGANPKAFRRKSRGTYSASFYELPSVPEDVLKESYPMLSAPWQTSSLLRVPGKGVWFTTMERGTTRSRRILAEILRAAVAPRHVKLVIDNE